MKPLLLITLLIAWTAFSSAQIIHVPADHLTIQAAIDAAADGDTILVAEATYLENINFRGKEITVASLFILDGDTSHISKTIIDGSSPAYADSASVVNMALAKDTTSVLCGFTIQGGAGTLCASVGEFTSAVLGGGILQAGGKITNNIIRENHIVTSGLTLGAGIAGVNQQALEDRQRSIIIRDNKIFNNTLTSSDGNGGSGISLQPLDGLTLVENNEISNNIGTVTSTYKATGGGLYIMPFTSTTGKTIVRNNAIHHNELHCMVSVGGGIYVVPWYDTPVTNYQPVEIYNNIISDNYSEYMGGGIGVWYFGAWEYMAPLSAVIYNNTIVNNKAEVGSGISNIDAEALLFNNIIYNENDVEGRAEIFNQYFSHCPGWCAGQNRQITHTFYNNIRNGWSGAGNIDKDPYFTLDSISLSDSSMCVGRGVDSIVINDAVFYAPVLDYAGNNRRALSPDGRIDVGAFESEYAYSDIYVSPSILNVPGEYPTIQEGIDAADEGDTVLVADGLYYENINYRGKEITVGSHYLMDPDDMHTSNTVIDGSRPVHPDSASVVRMLGAKDTTSVLCGFTLTGGTGTLIEDNVFYHVDMLMGGGLICSNGKIVNNSIHHNLLESNYCVSGGGIISFRLTEEDEPNGSLIIRNNTVSDNSISSTYLQGVWGAGISINHKGKTTCIENNRIAHNIGTLIDQEYKAMGGGLFVMKYTSNSSKIFIRNNRIYANELHALVTVGAGIYYVNAYDTPDEEYYPAHIYNNLIYDNYSESLGGGIGVWYVGARDYQPPLDPVVYNNTLSNNRLSGVPVIP